VPVTSVPSLADEVSAAMTDNSVHASKWVASGSPKSGKK